ncbi:hypothetical protein V8C44DRAFT_329749 [Trichoderma aethiopicum]
MPDAAYDARTLSDLLVVIQCVASLHLKYPRPFVQLTSHSSSGDPRTRIEDCGTFKKFGFPTTAESFSQTQAFVELPLSKPLLLEVGNEGIIGRRVSLYAGASPGRVVAEGIVGVNFLRGAQPSLGMVQGDGGGHQGCDATCTLMDDGVRTRLDAGHLLRGSERGEPGAEGVSLPVAGESRV